ncbi:lipopolysaccharide transport system ATP-binding protein [Nitrosospira sp. Nl5]|uniref:ABC transporter ATP-binding protein n=1 Tax=Nitrosospira sp. Nl5 TaxID=200120 RepID=UPI00088A16C5|nr:ABC transporter ATP-binding protein [Nitrosospira sp. Nl5]SCY20983.1 lipopolysaccharide transport system ATP-binding protein [Nitrosospira sp. Nl5]
MNTDVIRARDLRVEFPTYTADRSLKRAVLKATTGGRIARDSRSYISVRAIDGISFNLKSGNRVGLLGHNGSGKTTLLRVLAGAYEPVSGSLEMHGRIASLLDISMGMEGDATGYDNILLRGLMMGLDAKEIRKQMPEIAEFTELGEYLDMPLRTYSSGMQIRLAFAVSTAISADILLMDEWLSVGDENFQQKAAKRLQRRVDESSVLVIASHSPELISKVCNRAFRLDHGKIIEEFDPRQKTMSSPPEASFARSESL